MPLLVRLTRHAHAQQLRLLGTPVLELAALNQLVLGLSCVCPGVGTLLALLLQPPSERATWMERTQQVPLAAGVLGYCIGGRGSIPSA